MEINEAYNEWAGQYDENLNRTRDLEALAFREVLSGIPCSHCLEIGCGTGKNTSWLAEHSKRVTAVDFSEGMLARAREKLAGKPVRFIQADINLPWDFSTADYDLISFSLVLEHIGDLNSVFAKSARALRVGGYLYLGELHPFKQYVGSKARFETETGISVLTCFTHHISEFMNLSKANGFRLEAFEEYFDDGSRLEIPRLLVMLFRKAE